VTGFAEVGFDESTFVLLLKPVIVFVFVLSVVPMILLLERKLLGRFQSRLGPNRVGPFGLLQPMADVLKLLSKEHSIPATAVPWMMAIAPAISIFTAVATLAIIPFGDTRDDGIFGGSYGLYGIDVSIGILYAFAFGALAFYGFVLGGWASGSKYSFLGAMRSAAQLISYEVALGLSLLGVVFMAGSLSLTDIVVAQGPGADALWFIVPQFIGFCIFLVAGFAETARPPFDLPEADAEIVAGYNTEYGGMRFGSFFMAEYMHMIVFAGLGTAIFLGGWHGPGPGWLDPFWVILKMFLILVLFIWVRATLPRLRYDQLMAFGWKVLLPIATVNALVTATLVVVL
jgi:NADH-quinone oxidoreductase subunit H